MDKLRKFEVFAGFILDKYKKYDIGLSYTKERVSYYNSNKRNIVINEVQSRRHPDEACIAFLHEFGHAIINCENFQETTHEDWLLFWYKDTITENIRLEEYQAWVFGSTMLDEMKDYLPTKKHFMKRIRKKFNAQMKKCLKAYAENNSLTQEK